MSLYHFLGDTIVIIHTLVWMPYINHLKLLLATLILTTWANLNTGMIIEH